MIIVYRLRALVSKQRNCIGKETYRGGFSRARRRSSRMLQISTSYDGGKNGVK